MGVETCLRDYVVDTYSIASLRLDNSHFMRPNDANEELWQVDGTCIGASTISRFEFCSKKAMVSSEIDSPALDRKCDAPIAWPGRGRRAVALWHT
jgi:hypothetical protein